MALYGASPGVIHTGRDLHKEVQAECWEGWKIQTRLGDKGRQRVENGVLGEIKGRAGQGRSKDGLERRNGQKT